MFILKACPKCKGDLAAETNARRMAADDDIICIQCGYYLRPEETRSLMGRVMPVPPRRLQPAPAYARAGR